MHLHYVDVFLSSKWPWGVVGSPKTTSNFLELRHHPRHIRLRQLKIIVDETTTYFTCLKIVVVRNIHRSNAVHAVKTQPITVQTQWTSYHPYVKQTTGLYVLVTVSAPISADTRIPLSPYHSDGHIMVEVNSNFLEPRHQIRVVFG